jgi:hypothetical protein
MLKKKAGGRMEKKLFLLTIMLMFTAASVFADLTLQNHTDYVMGARIQNSYRGFEEYYTVNPGKTMSVPGKREILNISAQLLTGSYEINCCEWVSISDNEKLSVVFSDSSKNRCHCEIK